MKVLCHSNREKKAKTDINSRSEVDCSNKLGHVSFGVLYLFCGGKVGELATLGQRGSSTMMKSLPGSSVASRDDSDVKRNSHSASPTHKFSERQKKVSTRSRLML